MVVEGNTIKLNFNMIPVACRDVIPQLMAEYAKDVAFQIVRQCAQEASGAAVEAASNTGCTNAQAHNIAESITTRLLSLTTHIEVTGL